MLVTSHSVFYFVVPPSQNSAAAYTTNSAETGLGYVRILIMTFAIFLLSLRVKEV